MKIPNLGSILAHFIRKKKPPLHIKLPYQIVMNQFNELKIWIKRMFWIKIMPILTSMIPILLIFGTASIQIFCWANFQSMFRGGYFGTILQWEGRGLNMAFSDTRAWIWLFPIWVFADAVDASGKYDHSTYQAWLCIASIRSKFCETFCSKRNFKTSWTIIVRWSIQGFTFWAMEPLRSKD